MKKQDRWNDFHKEVNEYLEMQHAGFVPDIDLKKLPSQSYYLPMHGVVKASSSTTKLRIVYDASAKSSSGVSLNDTLLPGPPMYPLLTTLLNRFRTYKIGMSADISKMFREVGLHPSDYDFH